MFLTGEPGSGKTHTVNQFISYLRDHGIQPAITASTGIAATHIGGMTVHSWSGIGIKTELEKRDLHKIATTQHITKRVRNSSVLIIDEVSMLAPETLTMVDQICRLIRESSLPFGGMQVIFVGDFFQLPPVHSTSFAYDSPAWVQSDPVTCYLTEQHRQDDKVYLDLLSVIRRNSFTSSHLVHLQSRKISIQNVPDNVPKLYSHNADVDRINDKVLAKIPGHAKLFEMSSTGPEPLVAALKRGCLSPEKLFLKISASVMFTKNNPKEGYVNGTLGEIIDFDKTTDYPIVQTKSGYQIDVLPADWAVEENGRIRAQVSQLPLRLAWAITVHKSQGMSMDEAIMDLSDVFEYGQGYVALSRVRRLSGLYILGWNQRVFQVHPEVLTKDETSRKDSTNAEKFFSDFDKNILEQKQREYISKIGGKSKSTSRMKVDTYEETLHLWNEGETLLQISIERNLKINTIISHLEKLVRTGKIKKEDLKRLVSSTLAKSLPKIHDAFRKLDTTKLAPVYENLNGKYSYDQLRLARLLIT